MKHVILLLILLCSAPLLQAGELYRWVDEAGKVHYGDAPPPGVQAETRRFPAANGDEGLSYETRRARENFPVTLYIEDDTCGSYCQQARDMLNRRGIPFSEKKLVAKEEIEAFKKASGGDLVPSLSVGRRFLSGFDETRWNNELDIAGYPKTAPYRAPAAPVDDEEAAPVDAGTQ
ncbi:MAG: hypothetical protein A2Z95_08830 [Gallionellales bacterium GWA2_60_18]|nr:MAG: hypothetical protein A2Z95_08830 [Gallionellales bacterium GWA2_60_18]